MLRVLYLVNRFVAPFMTGVFVAATASTNQPVLAAFLSAIAIGFALLSLPATERVVTRALSELDELTAWSAE